MIRKLRAATAIADDDRARVRNVIDPTGTLRRRCCSNSSLCVERSHNSDALSFRRFDELPVEGREPIATFCASQMQRTGEVHALRSSINRGREQRRILPSAVKAGLSVLTTCKLSLS